MCATCGCGGEADHEHVHGHEQPHGHDGHAHPHEHPHAHDERAPRMIQLEQDVLAKNHQLAERNRGWFEGRGVLALNLLGSPGAGKTSLLERTLEATRGELAISVIEGDQATELDAERIRAAGGPVLQVNTGTGCHLDARMVADCLPKLALGSGAVLMIENVGNLVCPALFDLGERAKVVLLSVTEGEDKPLKYPHMFRAAELLLLNKVDLLPHVRFDVQRCLADARRLNPRLEVIELSTTRGDGLPAWLAWLRARLPARAGAELAP